MNHWIDQPTCAGHWWHYNGSGVYLERVYDRVTWPVGLCVDSFDREFDDDLCSVIGGLWMGPIEKPFPPNSIPE